MRLPRRAFGAIALALVATGCATTTTVRFTGQPVSSSALGIFVMADDAKRIVVVTSAGYRYSLVLPYSTEWSFTREPHNHLRGRAGAVNLTLKIMETPDTVEDYLRWLKGQLSRPGVIKGLEQIEIVKYGNDLLLRDVVDAEAVGGPQFRGVKSIHFFSAKRRERLLYSVHLSIILTPEEQRTFNERAFRQYVTLGLNVDFQAKN